MRCCKDLGVASELWDPRFIKRFMSEMGKETMVEHVVTKKRRKHWMRKDDESKYPFKDIGMPGQGTASGNGGGVATKAGQVFKSAASAAKPAAEKKSR